MGQRPIYLIKGFVRSPIQLLTSSCSKPKASMLKGLAVDHFPTHSNGTHEPRATRHSLGLVYRLARVHSLHPGSDSFVGDRTRRRVEASSGPPAHIPRSLGPPNRLPTRRRRRRRGRFSARPVSDSSSVNLRTVEGSVCFA